MERKPTGQLLGGWTEPECAPPRWEAAEMGTEASLRLKYRGQGESGEAGAPCPRTSVMGLRW